MKDAEIEQGCNLFCYVHNDPVNFADLLGLRRCETEFDALMLAIRSAENKCAIATIAAAAACAAAAKGTKNPIFAAVACALAQSIAAGVCLDAAWPLVKAKHDYDRCMEKPWIESGSPCSPVPNTFPNV